MGYLLVICRHYLKVSLK